MMLNNLKGTRDFYPEEWDKIIYLQEVFRKVSKRYGFEEYEAPVIEKAELWLKKSGGEIPEQMYVFHDKNDELIALRPEMTPSLARMIAKKVKELKKPIKWFSFPRVFRYEQPQSGRLREFFQYNADVIGADPLKSTVEIILLTIDILREFGLDEKDFVVKINNRKLLENLVKKYTNNVSEVFKIIDKKDKISEEDFKDLLSEYISNVDEFISFFEKENDFSETKKLFDILKTAGYEKYVEFDLSIVRGLNYYTDYVFEVFDRKKEFRAIAGGGNYSNLIESFSNVSLNGCGIGIGDVVLSLLLERKKLFKKYQKNIDYFIATIGNVTDIAFKVASVLRNRYSVDINLLDKGLSKQFAYANSIGAKKLIIVGERDLESNIITLKDLSTGDEKKLSLNSLLRGDFNEL